MQPGQSPLGFFLLQHSTRSATENQWMNPRVHSGIAHSTSWVTSLSRAVVGSEDGSGESCFRPWLVANRATLPQKWPPPPWNVAGSREWTQRLNQRSRLSLMAERFTVRAARQEVQRGQEFKPLTEGLLSGAFFCRSWFIVPGCTLASPTPRPGSPA